MTKGPPNFPLVRLILEFQMTREFQGLLHDRAIRPIGRSELVGPATFEAKLKAQAVDKRENIHKNVNDYLPRTVDLISFVGL
jgi:hypothetical protein